MSNYFLRRAENEGAVSVVHDNMVENRHVDTQKGRIRPCFSSSTTTDNFHYETALASFSLPPPLKRWREFVCKLCSYRKVLVVEEEVGDCVEEGQQAAQQVDCCCSSGSQK